MKTLYLTSLVILSLILSYPTVEGSEKTDATAVSITKEMTSQEAAAVEALKKNLVGIHDWLIEEIWLVDNKQARAQRLPLMLSGKLAGISIEGLPVELEKAFQAYRAAYQKQADLLKGLPEDLDKVMEWMAVKQENEAFLQEDSALTESTSMAGVAFIAVAESYGIGTEADLFRSEE
jgi:hypothetical protein